ncbi:glycosyltransferase family 87 protein [Blastococcus xanthinilyticus]|uniref:glycosyltransferase family 87 protein n=1 Tax=Blastococcus xanthinilyticus TaxID=1564164 RepID=UPI001FB572B9|nr:glycosyltransferase 87 family protein [Blastococcus xanthinilyticus]
MPSWVDPVVRQASEAVGGPWGRFAVTGRALFWTPLRVCLLFTTLVLAVAWIKQAPCSDGNWTAGVQYTHLCYSDAVPLFGTHGLGDGALPHLDVVVDQPVLTGGFTAVAAALAGVYDRAAAGSGVLPEIPPVQSYYVLTCLLLTACAFLLVRSTLALAGRRPWDAAIIGLSPLLLVHAFTGWDLFAVALAGLALWAWARRRLLLAGALTGLAAAAALHAVLLLLALLLLCLRAGRLRAWSRTALAAAGTWLAVVLPVALAGPAGWAVLPALPGVAAAEPDSLWNIAVHLTGGPGADPVPALLDAVAVLVGLAGLAAVAWLTRVAPVRPRVPQVAFLLVAVVLLTGTTWSPQESLWLLPLAALARPRWRSLLAWQATEAVLWVPRLLWYLGADDMGVDVEWFFLAVGLRDVAVLVLMALVVRDVLDPDRDVVRTSWPGVDDPAGGVLDHHMDALRASPPPRAVPRGR